MSRTGSLRRHFLASRRRRLVAVAWHPGFAGGGPRCFPVVVAERKQKGAAIGCGEASRSEGPPKPSISSGARPETAGRPTSPPAPTNLPTPPVASPLSLFPEWKTRANDSIMNALMKPFPCLPKERLPQTTVRSRPSPAWLPRCPISAPNNRVPFGRFLSSTRVVFVGRT